MKYLLVLLTVLSLPLCAIAQAPARADLDGIDTTSEFIFYGILEGLYADGVSTADAQQILLRTQGGAYLHFIYTCPICSPTVWALETYCSRPVFYKLKSGRSTFGKGLPADLREELYSEDLKVRLAAINKLAQKWLTQRMERLRLDEKERTELVKALEEKRKQGMNALQRYRDKDKGNFPGQDPADPKVDWVKSFAPGYGDLDECAVCNGAVGKPMALPERKK